jgi:hypothetical protein
VVIICYNYYYRFEASEKLGGCVCGGGGKSIVLARTWCCKDGARCGNLVGVEWGKNRVVFACGLHSEWNGFETVIFFCKSITTHVWAHFGRS